MSDQPFEFCGMKAFPSAQGLSSFVGAPPGPTRVRAVACSCVDSDRGGRGFCQDFLLYVGNSGSECHGFNAAMTLCRQRVLNHEMRCQAPYPAICRNAVDPATLTRK